MNGTAWTYFTQDQLGSEPYWGLVATYSGGGSYQVCFGTLTQMVSYAPLI